MTMINLGADFGEQRPSAMEMDPRRDRVLRGLTVLISLLGFHGCGAGKHSTSGPPVVVAADVAPASMRSEESRMWMTVGERRFAITLTDNAAARAFAAHLPLTLDMSELNGNEKHASLPQPLPANASRPGTIRNGDIMLYGTDTLVVFYLTFNSSYSYTRLGRVEEPANLAEALGRSGVRVVFSKD